MADFLMDIAFWIVCWPWNAVMRINRKALRVGFFILTFPITFVLCCIGLVIAFPIMIVALFAGIVEMISEGDF